MQAMRATPEGSELYKHIVVAIDNSDCSNYGTDLGIDLARKLGVKIVGNHVYAARLHDMRFQQMESGLPERYQREDELERQRRIHDSLISKGLELISESYLAGFRERCRQLSVQYETKIPEGRNYEELIKDVRASDYDLMIIGALGMGCVSRSVIGSVCERVTRGVRCDVLVVRESAALEGGRLLVAIDGSSCSFGALHKALVLSRTFGCEVEAVAVYDPFFHSVAFGSIAKVLTEEAGKIFRFREQEQLHDEIIDRGLMKLYGAHLERAKAVAAVQGVELTTSLLAGKPFAKIVEFLEERPFNLVVVGRFGLHYCDGLDIGSTAENLVRLAPTNVLVVGDNQSRENDGGAAFPEERELPWTPEAEATLQRVPPFARGMARRAIDELAQEKGYSVVTPKVVAEARRGMGM
ncbi:MAG: universal stress protein [Chloroflexi bacterium]|nr:universal stress protein [Chloroflexota bacterium]